MREGKWGEVGAVCEAKGSKGPRPQRGGIREQLKLCEMNDGRTRSGRAVACAVLKLKVFCELSPLIENRGLRFTASAVEPNKSKQVLRIVLTSSQTDSPAKDLRCKILRT